jgi:quinol monooxygenase YgiN
VDNLGAERLADESSREGNLPCRITSILATIRVKEEKTEALSAALINLVEPSRLEPNCLSDDVHQAMEDSYVLMVYENWRSADDLDAHFETPTGRPP